MSGYFSDKERACSHCGELNDNPVLIEMMNKARRLAGIPFIVTSWYRCPEHNEAIGSRPTSSHVKGKAVDIAFKNSVDCFKIVDSLLKAGFVRIGINFKEKFIHCDISLDKIYPVIFSY